MNKLIGIVGIPGTGKSTLMKNWMSTREWSTDKPVDLVDTHISDNIRVIVKYEEGEVFSGTDRLSMAVQPKFLEFLESANNETVLFEGDRLTSTKVFQRAIDLGWNVSIIHLTVSDIERERRYAERESNQSEQFINGRKTKVGNVVEQFSPNPLFGEPGNVIEFKHETEADTKFITNYIENLV